MVRVISGASPSICGDLNPSLYAYCRRLTSAVFTAFLAAMTSSSKQFCFSNRREECIAGGHRLKLQL
jgi:hypothetical protein